MAKMPADSVDAIVTDPPYGLTFMGKEWDRLDTRQPDDVTFHRSGAGPFDRAKVRHSSAPSYGGNAARGMQAWHEVWAREALRVLKPGGHLLAFGGTRTYHRMVCAIEDAGFEIRDSLHWIYGSGFPKSLDVSKAIDKMAGAEREVVGSGPYNARRPASRRVEDGGEVIDWHYGSGDSKTTPATEAAQQWQGWGTALKPAHEPIVMARKPLSEKNVAQNVLKYGTGAINVDATRVQHDSGVDLSRQQNQHTDTSGMRGIGEGGYKTDHMQPLYDGGGRWPPNLLLSLRNYPGEGGASRFFPRFEPELAELEAPFRYVAKASRRERNAGLEGMPEQEVPGIEALNRPQFTDLRMNRSQQRIPQTNNHPTVKPIALMRWLVRLVTPPGGTVLDPFMGSGSTGCAAVQEGFDFIGIEMDEEYVEIARCRIAYSSGGISTVGIPTEPTEVADSISPSQGFTGRLF